MKKVNYLITLNFAALMCGLVICICCIQFVACKKEAEISKNTEGVSVEEEFIPSEDIEPIYDDNSDAALKIDSISGPKASTTNDIACQGVKPYKYAGFFVVGKGENSVDLTINLSKYDSAFTSVVTNRDTSISVSGLTRLDSTHYRIHVATISDWFTQKTVKFTFKRTVAGIEKVVSKTIRIVGMNNLGNLYGSQLWGLNSKNVHVLPNSANGVVMSSSYVPQMDDLIQFSNQTQYCYVLSAELLKAATATTKAKYKVKTIQYNSDCNGGTTKRTVSAYADALSDKILNKDKLEYAVRYFR